MTKTTCLKAFQQKWIALFLLFLLFLSHTARAQTDYPPKRNTVYVELFTYQPVYSLNYERIFSFREKVRYSYRAGISVAKDEYYVPVGLSLITGQKASHAEFSFTLAPYITHDDTADSYAHEWDTFLYLVPAIGYRYQPPKGGPFFRLNASPAILLDLPAHNLEKTQASLEAALYLTVGYSF